MLTFTPNAKMSDIKDRQIARQSQHDRLFVVTSQWRLFSILIGNSDAIWRWLWSTANPELCICVAIESAFSSKVSLHNLTKQTWSNSIVAKVGNQQSLCINNDNRLGMNGMDSLQASDLLWSWKLQILVDDHIAKVDRELIAIDGEPFDVAQGLSLWQRQCDVLVAVALQHSIAAALVTNSKAANVRWCTRVADVEIGSCRVKLV